MYAVSYQKAIPHLYSNVWRVLLCLSGGTRTVSRRWTRYIYHPPYIAILRGNLLTLPLSTPLHSPLLHSFPFILLSSISYFPSSSLTYSMFSPLHPPLSSFLPQPSLSQLKLSMMQAGWQTLMVPHKELCSMVRLEVKGVQNNVRVRQLQILAQPARGLETTYPAPIAQQKACEAVALRVFRLLTSQVWFEYDS